jgi:Protein of unknown function (DUF3102)
MNEHQGLRVSASEWATRINATWQKTVANIVETGHALIDAKSNLPHGAFTEMIENDLPFSPRVAEHLMVIATNPALSNPKHASDLPVSWATLAELARLGAGTVEKLTKVGSIRVWSARTLRSCFRRRSQRRKPRPPPSRASRKSSRQRRSIRLSKTCQAWK